ncbi:Permease of the drug/metabolite transporter (DMT) superfamily [Acetitomaculum ruminis DSM 5522]|uniref:Permease of the drug/metabolite transporter (DMT) superfamily n=1 Tax=Acetitomaculum ruminis DSM 5522 TaxID=1120918 RepID=A0A1I1ASF1_9FIRM|nr:EamA family transporter [Acetitomaculum ruminis]SFB40985.1 Permease of the drug/metabolite transporter (DMT) superfamily [Acetitomaculum ruminis DSM 5522]
MEKQLKFHGPLMMVFAALCFSTGGAVLKLVPWNPFTINGVRNIFAAMVIGTYIIFTHHKLKINKSVLFGTLCMFSMSTLFVLANKLTSAANAIILQYTCPVWIIVLMALLFRKKATKKEIITVIIVFIGILCFFYDSLGNGDIKGDLVAVLAGIFYAGLYIINEFKDGDSLSSFFFGQLLCGIVLSPNIVKETDFSPIVIISVIFLGAVQIGLAYIFFAEGTKHTPPVPACLISTIEPILNPIIVAIVWSEVMSPVSLAGAAIVVIAILTYNLSYIKFGK